MKYSFPKAVLFDLSNTLVRQGSLIDAAVSLSDQEITASLKLTHHQLEELGERIERSIQRMYATCEEAQPDYVDVWAKALAQFGVVDTKSVLHFAHAHLEAFAASQNLYPESCEILQEFRNNCIPIVLASNTTGPSMCFRDQLQKLGVSEYFSRMFFSSDVGWRKPSQQFFQVVLREMNWSGDNSHIWMIGDNEVADIGGARAMGFRSILISSDSEVSSNANLVLGHRDLRPGRLLSLSLLFGHPAFTGTQGMVANMQKKKSGRRKWTVQLTVETPEKKVTTPHNHPLNSVNQRGREESRLQTLAEVLAAIAKRRTSEGVTG